jgi:hypothetical protein
VNLVPLEESKLVKVWVAAIIILVAAAFGLIVSRCAEGWNLP